MSDNEYDEENLDEFMVNASSILSEESNPEKETIIDTLKQHLSQIFHDQNEMQNFLNTLNSVIFSSYSDNSKTLKIENKQPFKIYPIIFSFNPKTSYYYFDFFLESLQKCACEENRSDFTYLSLIFSEVILAFFSDEKKNKHLMKKSFLLEQNKKIKMFEKILNFCNQNIKTNKKTEQSFGLLLLTEFIEKCPLIKEDKYLENIFKILAEYLDDRWFECKLDLLNCTISLIFTSEAKFKPYANVCLFKVLDYLTDTEWMKRKLAINIVYTLVFYCKEEIMAVKDNIIDFLNMLKDDSVEEVRDVCLQTLKFIEENDPEYEENKNNEINIENNKPKNVFNKNKNDLNMKKKNNIKKNNQEGNIKNKNMNKKKNDNELIEKEDNINNDINNNENDLNNPFGSSINSILQQLNKIQEDQNKFINIINDIKQTVDNNYSNLNERVKNLEKIAGIKSNDINNNDINNFNNNNNLPYNSNSYNLNNKEININTDRDKDEEFDIRSNKSNKGPTKNTNKKIVVISKKEEQNKINDLKQKFISGKYNEVLLESKDNEKYLLKLIPLIDKNIIQQIETPILEDIINRLNKKLSLICLSNSRANINDILLFYIQLIKSKINLKLMTQLSIKDTLKFIKIKRSNKLIQSDINNIDIILKALKA